MASVEFPGQSPLYHAQRVEQYARQELIRQYENEFSCRLIVMIDRISPRGVTLFQELIFDANSDHDLHVLLHSPGGLGEVAIRILRAAQSKCKELTVIVPDQAKSAATLLALGAHHIVMGPASDLGPIDPQFVLNEELVAAKDIIAAVDEAAEKVVELPETSGVYAPLLSDVTAVMLQEARSALQGTSKLLEEALSSNPDRTPEEVSRLQECLKVPMIEGNPTHSALFSADDAEDAGLPVVRASNAETQWQLIWRLWTKYFALGQTLYTGIYEGSTVSQIGLEDYD